MKIEIYQDAASTWKWRAVNAANRIICDGTECAIDFVGIEKVLEDVMTQFRADVEVVRRNKRRTVATAGRREDVLSARGTQLDPAFDVIANYDAEGTHGHDTDAFDQ